MSTGREVAKAVEIETKGLESEQGSGGKLTGRHVRTGSRSSANGGLSRHKSVKKPEPRYPPLPSGASPRVLCLDSGGIRGIVQLEILRGIEHALGDHIPASAFFDLIVGSGTGGLIAMTLSMRNQTVDTCADRFKTICDRAFKPKLKAAPLVRSISSKLGSGRRYQHKSLYDVLQTTFGEENSLLDSPQFFTQGSRVAVTSRNSPEKDPFLLANYPQQETLERDNEQDQNLKVWQSVAAAIADPTYFPAFEHETQKYIDGGLNPAAVADKERRLLWPEADGPDLFLSLGTGQDRLTVLQKLSNKQSSDIQEERESTDSQPARPVRPARMSRRWSVRKDEEVMDAEKAWTDFKVGMVRDGGETKSKNFVRLNPDLGRTPPSPDNKHEIESLQDNVRKGLLGSPRKEALRNIAHRLVASSFYLDSRSTATDEHGDQIFTGTIACRFKYGSIQLRALGRILRDRTTSRFEPYFLIKPDASSKYQSSIVKFTKEKVHVMIERGIFALPSVSIPLHDESKQTTINLFLQPNDELEPDGFPISSFPDVLDNQLARVKSKPSPIRSRQRALSDQRFEVVDNAPKMDLLSRAKSTSVMPRRFASKRSTFSPTFAPPKASLAPISAHKPTLSASSSRADSSRVSMSDIIAEEQQQQEQQQQSGAFIERRTSRFWQYIGNNHMAQNPELYSTEEIAQFSRPRPVRSSSIGTEFESQMDDPFADQMWSPLEGKPSYVSFRCSPGDLNPP